MTIIFNDMNNLIKRFIKEEVSRLLSETTLYHSTRPESVPHILRTGLKTGSEMNHTQGGSWAIEHYGKNPIYVSVEPGVYSGVTLEIEGSDIPLVSDLPTLLSHHGAMISDDGQKLWWEEGDEPPGFDLNEYGEIDISELLDPNSASTGASIRLTGTGAILEDIPPDRIKVRN